VGGRVLVRVRVDETYLGDLIGCVASVGGTVTNADPRDDSLVIDTRWDRADAATMLRHALDEMDPRWPDCAEILD
jgi:hypothetical protein